ncbi:hypothetical protein BpHYR1_007665 [Brachionus plicatilis]|uniref:Uncharacterized protein n=1 Tax=Brachionus plicatilis TaxID=10195 RepID=A0A3M7T9L9_BRAPC|nr:hypothetical protein BpHYR1_007665 [Brachionus plicatilis]
MPLLLKFKYQIYYILFNKIIENVLRIFHSNMERPQTHSNGTRLSYKYCYEKLFLLNYKQ